MLFYQDSFDDDEILEIENARYQYIINKHQKNKYSTHYMSELMSNVEKPEELNYLIDCVKEGFDKLDSNTFSEMVGTISTIIELIIEDNTNIEKYNFLNSCVAWHEEKASVLQGNKEDLISYYIKYSLDQWEKLFYKIDDTEEY